MELPPSPSQAPCAGKCDGLASDFKDYFSDMRNVDLGDLVNVGAELATKQLNEQLEQLPYADIELEPTEIYASSSKASGDLTLKDLESITSGLVARYGDQAFVSRVNKLRAAYLKQHPDRVFAESAFSIGAKYAPSFSFQAGGLPGKLGFLAAKGVDATVVAPYKGELKAVLQGPIKAIRAARGFLLPRDLKDIEAMAPGETLALHSKGTVGINVGLGMPFYLTTIGSAATVHAVISAGAGATLTGELDIQLIRDAGTQVVVDVGVTDLTSRYLQLGAKTRYGIEGIPEVKLKVGPLDLDASEVAEKALEDLLDQKLGASLTYQSSKQHVRHTVARFTFDLSRVGAGAPDPVEQALIQALRGDLRLAQALANRPGSGVVQLLDLTRDARSLSSYLGLHFLSLRFFSGKADKSGSVIITTDAGSQQLLFDELEKQSGFWKDSSSYSRRTLVSLTSRDGALTDADVNLQLSFNEKRQHVSRDQVLDHVDPLLALFVGRKAFIEKLGPAVNAMQSALDHLCPEPMDDGSSNWQEQQKHEACLKGAAQDAEVVKRRKNAEAWLKSLVSQGIQGGLDTGFDDADDFVQALFELKLAVQGSVDGIEPWEQPKGRMLFSYRLTEQALASALAAPGAAGRFVEALEDTVYLMRASRTSTAGYQLGRDAAVAAQVADLADELKEAREEIDERAERFVRLVQLGTVSWQSKALGQTTLGDQAHLVLVEGSKDYDLASIAERKAKTARKLVDNLIKQLGWSPDLFIDEKRLVAYALLGLVQPAQAELLVDLDFKQTDWNDYPDVKLYGRGQGAKLIDAGQFSIEALIGD